MTKRENLAVLIRAVLARAGKGKGPDPHFITSYQILDRLPATVREELVARHGTPGRGAGGHASAAKAIARAISGMGDVETNYLDTRGVDFRIGDDTTQAGYRVCGLYRLART